MMGYVAMLLAATYCCDLALESVGERHSTPHPSGLHFQPKHRMRWLVSRVAHHEEDIGQGEGCEGGKCAVRSAP